MPVCKQSMPRRVHTTAGHQVETMGRKQFNGFLYDIYGCGDLKISNDVVAETTFHGAVNYVEVFNSPEGLIVAIYDGSDTVHLVRPFTGKQNPDLSTEGYALPEHGRAA